MQQSKKNESQNLVSESGDLEILGLCLYMPSEQTLIIADLHLGVEETTNKECTPLARTNYSEIGKHLERIFTVLETRRVKKLKKIIINGDLKHESGTISEQEWKEVLDMLEYLQKKCEKIILVKGDHDTILGPIGRRKEINVEKSHFIPEKKVLFLHGHKTIGTPEFNKAEVLVIGHEHPAITLRDGAKREKYKCFLRGKFGGKELIVMPSLNSVHAGTDVKNEKLLSPFLQQRLENFECWVSEEGETYRFGMVAEL